jgi:hypothetical protein
MIECPTKYLVVDSMFFQLRSPKHFESIGKSGQAFEEGGRDFEMCENVGVF